MRQLTLCKEMMHCEHRATIVRKSLTQQSVMQMQALQSELFPAFTDNPYIAGNPVGHSEAFIGRGDVLKRVMDMFHHNEEHALVLHGQRRIGKTSVLQYLQRELIDDEHFESVYFDLQGKANQSIPKILEELYAVLRYELSTALPSSPELAWPDVSSTIWLQDVLDALPSSTRLVLLLDEVDVMRTHSPDTFTAFLQHLLADFADRVKLVLVIGHGIDEQSGALQSFLQTLPACHISLLSEEETQRLVKLSEDNGTLSWPLAALEAVWRYTNGHPLLTQHLCAHVWDVIYDTPVDGQPEVTPEDVASVCDEVLETSQNTLEWLWGGLSIQEKITASLMAEMGAISISKTELSKRLRKQLKVKFNPVVALKPLQAKDMVGPEDNGEHYRLRGELLRRWIAEHKPFRRVSAKFAAYDTSC